ncbi:hypothetical protein CRYUN_Cryun27aG0087500 [Craigia yunnanensis]
MALSTLTRFSTSTSSPFSSALIFNHFSKRITFTIATTKKSQPQSYKIMASSQAQVPLSQDKIITAPYGSWKSPITADVVSGSSKRLGGSTVDSQGHLFWLESRPSESGADSCPVPITPDYGGPFVSYADGIFDSRLDHYITVMEDRRESSINATPTIAAVPLDDGNIQGGSAGGYTTLAALAFRDTFKAGVSLYGLSFSLKEVTGS